ncbi:DUF362 domain-containing protein [Methanobrevibacter arboriphilus]|uniref:DUF362 domain-containing protein n=1 Tax=Methanobrevibacter arboriphilus TaxID=39441 RepID=UPI000B1264EE|nr:4Fe-4S binding protein [Methanobrevibacter arboriphilus]
MIVVNQEDCIKCGACEGTCPSAAIELEDQKVVYCDICGGEPKCVETCPQGALSVMNYSLMRMETPKQELFSIQLNVMNVEIV